VTSEEQQSQETTLNINTVSSGISNFALCKGLEVHYLEWGDVRNPTVILWHGLARTSRDFDLIAAFLADNFHVVVPDTIGRGLSQWSAAPLAEYCFDFYAELAQELIDQLSIDRFSWLGTSMGGALGIRVAAGALGRRMEALVLNDMGPEPNPAAMLRIKNYIGTPPEFETVMQFEAYCREIYKPFGWHSDQQWRHMALTSMRRLSDGRITTHYDPRIVRQLFEHPTDFNQWPAFDSIQAPMLLLRGEHSDIVLAEHAHAMKKRRSQLEIVEVSECGHAPALNVPAQWELVGRFIANRTLA
jgi:pimeloyl-ACP methyl ester carboxylesterase